jgi:predicted glycosyltransferase
MRIWIDIDNPPQVQYLLPFRAAFEQAGADTVITARDYGATVSLLEQAGVEARVFGTRLGRGKLRKAAGSIGRARALGRFFAADGRPDALLAASRSSAVAAWRLRIPSFIIDDYEHADVSVYRMTGSRTLHPDAIEPAAFIERGLRRDQLIPFRGLKEDISFRGVDLDAIEPLALDAPTGLVRVLFRPPSETSHYYRHESTAMALMTLRHLAQAGAVVVFSPREPTQVAFLEGLDWVHEPIVLERPAPFVALLKSVDAVVCSGGTMLREAAYLGIPAYSILQSEVGGVDRRLAELGRVTLISGPEDLGRLELGKRGPLDPLRSNPGLLDELVRMIVEQTRTSVALSSRLPGRQDRGSGGLYGPTAGHLGRGILRRVGQSFRGAA